MGKMTVGELMDFLSDYDEDTEVRLALQPSWPFEYRIGELAESYKDGETVLYIAEGGQIRYLPGSVRDDLGWR